MGANHWIRRLSAVDSQITVTIYVEITTDPDNIASQRVIESNGGMPFEHFIKPQGFGFKPGLRFRITLT